LRWSVGGVPELVLWRGRILGLSRIAAAAACRLLVEPIWATKYLVLFAAGVAGFTTAKPQNSVLGIAAGAGLQDNAEVDN
jgi:hypothetical protein